MGKSKRVTTVGTSVSRAIENEMVPRSPIRGVVGNLYRGGGVTENIQHEYIHGLGIRANRYYRYGENGKYPFGLPRGEIFSNSGAADKAIAVLKRLYGQRIKIDYVRTATYNFHHMGWMTVQDTYGYNSITQELESLTSDKGTPVILKDMIVETAASQLEDLEIEAYEQWGIKPGEFSLGFGYSRAHREIHTRKENIQDRVYITYAWEIVTETIHTEDQPPLEIKEWVEESVYLPLQPTDEESWYIFACYAVNDKRFFWKYRVGSGVYPELDNIDSRPQKILGEYYPFGYFRYGKTNPLDSPDSEEVKTSKKLMKFVDLPYEDVVEAIHENPDIQDVEQAMLFFGVSANTVGHLEAEYLFLFFSDIFKYSGEKGLNFSLSSGRRALGGASAIDPENVLSFQDARFQKSLEYSEIYQTIKQETIGEIGAYSGGNEKSILVNYVEIQDGVSIKRETEVTVHVFKHQISTHLCEVLEVTGLQMRYHIYGGHHYVATEDEEPVLVPLEKRILKKMSLSKQEQLVARSMHYVFNSRVVTKVKWYQRGFFNTFLKAAAIAIAVFSLGTQAPLAGALIAAGMYTALAIVIIEMVIIAIITSIAVKFAVNVLGPKFAAIIAVLAIAVRFSPLGDTIGSMPWAQHILKASTSLIGGIQDYYTKALQGLQKEFEEFKSESEKLWEELQETQKLLETNPILSPLYIIGESPSGYYGRTSYCGQDYLSPMEATKNYFDRALALPDFIDTFGETDYAEPY